MDQVHHTEQAGTRSCRMRWAWVAMAMVGLTLTTPLMVPRKQSGWIVEAQTLPETVRPDTVRNEAIRQGIPMSPDELLASAETGNVAAARLLLKAGIDVNARGARGQTALITASEHGHMDVVKLLLERDVDLHAKNIRGATALMLATLLDHTAVAQALKKAGAKE